MAEENSQKCILDLDESELRIREMKILKSLEDVQNAKRRLTVKKKVLDLAEGDPFRQRYLEVVLQMFGRNTLGATGAELPKAIENLKRNENYSKTLVVTNVI